jgi:putative toxin-antitoxin system antitoxin component (TIGR02293 family)
MSTTHREPIVIAFETLEFENGQRLRIIRVLSSAEAVYGSRERALAWLRKPQARLEGRSPLSLLKTDTGSLLRSIDVLQPSCALTIVDEG